MNFDGFPKISIPGTREPSGQFPLFHALLASWLSWTFYKEVVRSSLGRILTYLVILAGVVAGILMLGFERGTYAELTRAAEVWSEQRRDGLQDTVPFEYRSSESMLYIKVQPSIKDPLIFPKNFDLGFMISDDEMVVSDIRGWHYWIPYPAGRRLSELGIGLVAFLQSWKWLILLCLGIVCTIVILIGLMVLSTLASLVVFPVCWFLESSLSSCQVWQVCAVSFTPGLLLWGGIDLLNVYFVMPLGFIIHLWIVFGVVSCCFLIGAFSAAHHSEERTALPEWRRYFLFS